MAASTTTFGTLSVTLAQAIAYLTRPLIVRYSATAIIKLQLALEANLTSQFASSWVPTEPLRGSGRRCLTLSPHAVPPRSIYNACKSAKVEWTEWIALLGGIEFDLFIDPGCISVRFGNWETGKVSKYFTVWSEDLVKEGKAEALREPTWLTPILTQFPNVPVPARSKTSSPDSVCSATSMHSRSSSSSSSSGFSFFSNGSAASFSSATTVSLSPEQEKSKATLSRREKARQARVFIDTSKTDVTNYDGGKTTVLTGGVMLGGGRPAPQAKPAPAAPRTKAWSSNWRSSRA
ncbi:uncharacterized protein B0H18DRAFT_197963 [Fomitopsis serialis]|uniref:uncharacterized protein n=1 Tax=Fomitopsis serialis TaxID=139415 RepID=UPI002007310D|nr:uncharacterized protein B0H18DRAFT_197963 [Neoantrodia serialis]KAH9937444.1 hypothetical protein B0H18DRAFT_197963 [Neoantrodia serialis]